MQHAIDYAEFDGFHRVRKQPFRNAAFIPAFAFSDSQLRQAIAAQCFKFCHIARRGTLADFLKMSLNELRAECDRAEKKMPSNQHSAEHLRDRFLAGNYVDVIARVCWLSWRMGESSVDVAAQVEISPVKIRKILRLVANAGRALGFDADRRHHSAKDARIAPLPLQPKFLSSRNRRKAKRLHFLAAIRKRSADPRWRERNLEGIQRRTQDPRWRQNTAKANRRRTKDPRWRAAVRAGCVKRSLNPRWRAKTAELCRGRTRQMAHIRWHVRRGRVNPNCPLCQAAA